MKILYYDCFAGISGDMNLGALVDLGVDPEFLQNELGKLPVHGYELKFSRESRKGISGTRVEVKIDHLHSHSGHHQHSHGKGEHDHHSTYAGIKKMIAASKLNEEVKRISLSVFRIIAEAEAKIHNKPLDEVHFHEVGAIDSIVDIVGAAICIHKLAPDSVLCSTVELGGGSIQCAHGIYPVPAPATAEILKHIPVKKGSVNYEATTPTGAAILAACVNEFTDITDFIILKTGYGAGGRDGSLPNVLRVFLCESKDIRYPEKMPSLIIECNIDDMNPELYDYIIDSLFSAGAMDVYITPIIMKKSRPAVKLSVLCSPDNETEINEILLRETSTIGVRKYPVEKTMLDRKTELIQTKYGEIRVKSAYYHGKCIKSKPEYDDCNKLARENKVPISIVYREAGKEISKLN